MQVSVYNIEGQVTGQIDLDETIFGVQPNEALVHQALVRQLANARAGTADTKTRSEVAGSTHKLFRQKHTGFARAGSRRSPTRSGGGVAFGPHPRKYHQRMPKKMRRLALKSVLSSKVINDELMVIESFGIEQPKTKQISHILKTLGIESSALLVTSDPDINVVKSARNIDKVKIRPAYMLNVVDLLKHKVLLMTVEAVQKVETIWGKNQVSTEA